MSCRTTALHNWKEWQWSEVALEVMRTKSDVWEITLLGFSFYFLDYSFLFVFKDRVLCSSGWPPGQYVAKAGLE